MGISYRMLILRASPNRQRGSSQTPETANYTARQPLPQQQSGWSTNLVKQLDWRFGPRIAFLGAPETANRVARTVSMLLCLETPAPPLEVPSHLALPLETPAPPLEVPSHLAPPLETPWRRASKPHGAAPRNPCAAPRNPMAPRLETPGAPRLKTPGDKIWDQNFQVSVVFRPLRPKRAIPHPITIQNMRFRR